MEVPISDHVFAVANDWDSRPVSTADLLLTVSINKLGVSTKDSTYGAREYVNTVLVLPAAVKMLRSVGQMDQTAAR